MSLITTLRKFKILNIAMFDMTAVFILAVLIGYMIYKHSNSNKNIDITLKQTNTLKQLLSLILIVFFLMICIGILTHYILGIPTMLNYYLGLNTKESVMVKRKESLK